jgi:CRP/FNR family transcriptional regulator
MSRPSSAGTKVPPPPAVEAHPWILDVVSERTRAALLAAAVERRFGTGEILYLAGSPAQSLYLVLEGRVRLVRESHGRTIFLHDEERGGCLGEVPLFEGTTYPATAMASEPTRCLVLRRGTILEIVRTEPELALALLTRLAARVRHLVDRLDRNGSQSTLGRLAGHLLARSAASQGRGRAFTLGASQQLAAEELGTVRELVVRGLRTLRDRGAIVALGGGRYSVVDEALLRRVASDEA